MKIVFILFIFLVQIANCQKDSIKTYHLPEVELGQIRLNNFSNGNKIILLDSTIQKNTNYLSDVLQQQNFIFIKPYSPGNLSTPTFRGTSANHTALLWNGFNLQSSMNGQADFSLIPNLVSTQTKIQFGGNSALNGSGSVGGTIHLQHLPSFNKGISAEVGLQNGSFGAFRQQYLVEISKKNFVTSLKIYNQSALNNFQFQNIYLPEKPVQIQQNGAFQIKGLLTEHFFLFKKFHRINARYWLQHADRQIPATMLAAKKQESQIDFSHRITSEYAFQKNNLQFATRIAWFNENISYQRPLYDTVKNTSNTFIYEVETKIQLPKNQLINIGFNNTFSAASGNNLGSSKTLNRTAFFASYLVSILNQKIVFNTNLREQLDKGSATPLTFGFGIEAKPFKDFTFFANTNRSYRLPTLNDYFWRDAGGAKGNLDLKPELGWSQDVGIQFKKQVRNFAFQTNGTVFNSNISNWILWIENQNGILSPQNIQQVWARGIEYGGKITFNTSKTELSLTTNTDFTYSTVQSVSNNFSNLVGKQVIYVPYNKGFATFLARYHKTAITYNFVYTGFRFSNEDNSEFLAPFTVSNIAVNQDINYKKIKLLLFMQLNNIFNQQYQVLAMRPMYGFNFNFGLTFKFNQPNKLT